MDEQILKLVKSLCDKSKTNDDHLAILDDLAKEWNRIKKG